VRTYRVPAQEQRFPIVQECAECGLRDGNFCSIYRVPESKWTQQPCPMATHLKKGAELKEKALDPLKASKRKMRNG